MIYDRMNTLHNNFDKVGVSKRQTKEKQKKNWWKKDEQIRSGQNRDRQRVNSIKALRQ